MPSSGMSIGAQLGYWEEKKKDRQDKQDKVSVFKRRVSACKSLSGLDKVAGEARAAGLWHPVAGSVTACNARLRGREHPVLYKLRRKDLTITVHDNKAVGIPKMTRDLDDEGFVYAGKA